MHFHAVKTQMWTLVWINALNGQRAPQGASLSPQYKHCTSGRGAQQASGRSDSAVRARGRGLANTQCSSENLWTYSEPH